MVSKAVIGIAVLVIIILGIIAYSYSTYKTNSDNAIALSSLNQKITSYGANLRYVFGNNSAYQDVFNYSQNGYFANLTKTQPSIYSAISSFSSQSSQYNISNANSSDWYTQYPLLSQIVLNATNVLGLFSGTTLAEVERYNIVPSGLSSLQLAFSLELSGKSVIYFANVLMLLYKGNYFYPLSAKSINSSHYARIIPVNNLGVGIATIPVGGAFSSPGSVTTELNGTFYNDLSASDLSTSWLKLIYELHGFYGEGFPQINNSTAMNKLAYMIATSNYFGYYASEMLYNRTIYPEVTFIGYLNNTIMLDLGNIAPNDTNVSVYIDGNNTAYKKYYDIVVANRHLGVGEHSINLVIDGTSATYGFYVSPVLPSSPDIMIVNSGNNQTGSTNTITADLSFYINNPYASNMIISNISVISGFAPEPSVQMPGNPAVMLNVTGYASPTPVLSNVSYSKLNFITPYYDNYTKAEMFTPNVTTHAIPVNSVYNIGRNDSLLFNYTVSSLPYVIGMQTYYTVTFNTNYGKAKSIILVKLT